ncbi:MAG: hypothetical protein CL916_15410 [Deltaproteobacteria bacterium]|nr:hypothetical protein [Deltaproteobacteria bacterium]
MSCTSSLSIEITQHTEKQEPSPTTPCDINITKRFDIESPYVDITIESAERVTMMLELYEGKESLEREVILPTTGLHTLEMFWPKQSLHHSWQETYGIKATLTVIGFSGEDEMCRALFEGDFAPVDNRVQNSRFITKPHWYAHSVMASGLHVSVPALHESDKYALISTPLSHTPLSIIGPFDRDEDFRDITNLSIFENQEGKLLSLVAQESWPGFDEQLFMIHNAITTEQNELWSKESTIHHTISAQERSDGSLDVLTSSWDERFGISAGFYGHPTRVQLSEEEFSSSALIDVDAFYPQSQSSPLTYNNFVWEAGPKSTHVISIIFSNRAMALPPPEDNTSSVLLLDQSTGTEIWYSNPEKTSVIHEQNHLVVELDPIPEQELALTFPHAAQFDGERLYVQDHMDVESGSKQARINCFSMNGDYLWSFVVPSSLETTNNARRRHGGMWTITVDGNNGVCAFFVDTQTVHCVDQNGIEVGWMEKYELSENQADKWHTLDYLDNWTNTITP